MKNENDKCDCLWSIPKSLMSGDEQRRRVYSTDGLSPTLMTPSGGYFEAKIAMPSPINGNGSEENEMNENNKQPRLRIRKLTEGECMRLMGFEENDTEACRKANLSKANIYHQSGDSICVPVLIAIFGELLDNDYGKVIEEYTNGLHKETEEGSV